MATRKTTQKKSTSVKSASSNSSTSFSPSKLTIKNFILPAIIVAVVVLIGLFKNQFIVATVNGQPVTRLQLINALEKKDGKTVLSSIVTEQLILQEAQKKKISITASEINAEIAKIEKSVSGQGQSLDLLLTQQGMTRADLTDQVKIQLLLKKMVSGNVTATDKEIADYISQNKDSIPAGTNDTQLKSQVKQQLEQQKLNTKIQTFVADLQKNGKVEYWRNY